jgi:hypothetical protein
LANATESASSTQKQKIRFYPNPSTTGDVILELNDETATKKFLVQIISMRGEVLFSKVVANIDDRQLHSGLQAGLYTIRILQGDKILSSEKLIIRP